jgi:D-3-phosphoglycerate dehydrogenase / 2-oxoglutarate reductase
LKILVADKFPKKYQDELKTISHEVSYEPDLNDKNIVHKIKGFNVLIVRSTKVTAEAIEASDELCMIIRAGAGTNTIDSIAAANKGVFVCNTPGKNAYAVAELAVGLLISIDRKIPDNVFALRQKEWNKKDFTKSKGLFNRNVGIIGLGQIGLAFAERLKGFGVNLFAINKDNRSESAQKRMASLDFSFCKNLNELAHKCDTLSFHVPSTPETKHLINSEFLEHVQDNSIIINTSRGNIVDDKALIDAMSTKGIKVGLDVFNNEPQQSKTEFSTELTLHHNVYGTHHIGASTEQAQLAIAEEAIEIIKCYQKGIIRNCVNIQNSPILNTSISIRHYDKVGVLASVLNILKENGINTEQMENKVFTGAKAAFAKLFVNSEIKAEIAQQIRQLPNIIHVELTS